MAQTVPAHLYEDRYWKPVLYLFSNHYKLKGVFTTKYFDFKTGTIKVTALKKEASVWSGSEKFMLQLALHLFNERYKVKLSDMDYLDSHNKELVMKAMQLRFNC